jgi:hypothetical protein
MGGESWTLAIAPPLQGIFTTGCPSLTNEKQSGERLLRHRGMEGLPTFRQSKQLPP